jgi:hypothetical protein
MFAKVMPSNFIDALKLQLFATKGNILRAILKDDKGSICSVLEKSIKSDEKEFTWTGLNDLPYGKYTLELSQGDDEMSLNLVKRV